MELTDEELYHLQYLVYDEVYYGDDSVVYGEGDYATSLRSVLEKINAELKKRKA